MITPNLKGGCYICEVTLKWLMDIWGFFFFFLIIYFLAVFDLCCCAQAFSSCSEWALLFVVARGLLIAVASLVVEQGSRRTGFSSCGIWAQ